MVGTAVYLASTAMHARRVNLLRNALTARSTLDVCRRRHYDMLTANLRAESAYLLLHSDLKIPAIICLQNARSLRVHTITVVRPH